MDSSVLNSIPESLRAAIECSPSYSSPAFSQLLGFQKKKKWQCQQLHVTAITTRATLTIVFLISFTTCVINVTCFALYKNAFNFLWVQLNDCLYKVSCCFFPQLKLWKQLLFWQLKSFLANSEAEAQDLIVQQIVVFFVIYNVHNLFYCELNKWDSDKYQYLLWWLKWNWGKRWSRGSAAYWSLPWVGI